MKHTTYLATLALCLATLVLSGCATNPQPRYTVPALATVSVPLQRAHDAVKVARDRLDAGDVPAARAAIAIADAKVEESSRALDTKDAEVGQLVQAVADRDETIAAKDKVIRQISKERDIIPYLCAIGVALWFIGLADLIPVLGQYRLWLKGAAFVIGFGSGYGAGRLLVRSIATFLP
jgi:hypothetical protein